MPSFQLKTTLAENVKALRLALGSIAKELSREDLAEAIREQHPAGRSLNGSTVQRWETGVEPDLHSLRIMATLAGVTVEQFAFGAAPVPDDLADAVDHGTGIAQHEEAQRQEAEREKAEKEKAAQKSGRGKQVKGKTA